MKKTKWRKICRSKHQFPTRVIGKALHLGKDAALEDIRKSLGFSIAKLKKMHTKSQWRWGWPRGMSMRRAEEEEERGNGWEGDGEGVEKMDSEV